MFDKITATTRQFAEQVSDGFHKRAEKTVERMYTEAEHQFDRQSKLASRYQDELMKNAQRVLDSTQALQQRAGKRFQQDFEKVKDGFTPYFNVWFRKH